MCLANEGANAVGVLACFLSGAGSTLLALADGREEAIGAAMRSRWRDGFRIASSVQIVDVGTNGLRYDTWPARHLLRVGSRSANSPPSRLAKP